MTTHTTARYQLFTQTGIPFQWSEKPLPSCQQGEVLVKILLATICGSDIHTIDGKRKEDTPCILGHEAVGEIIAVNGRPGFSVGDRITWTIADSCGQCTPCADFHLPEKCDSLFKYGHASIDKGTGLNGCYASHLIVRSGTHIVKVPDHVTNAMAAPANCALATMVNVVSKLKGKPGAVAVQGGGLLGIYGCALLKDMGVEKVYCLEVNPDRFSLLEAFGATPVDARDPKQAIARIKSDVEHGVDAVLEVAGVKELLQQGVELLRPGGQYILAGLVHPDSAIDVTAEQIIRKCLEVTGVHNYGPDHLDKAIAFLDRNAEKFPFEKLVSDPYSLTDLSQAVDFAKQQLWARVSVVPQ